MEELSKEKRWIHHTATVPVSEEKLSQIQKEMEDQEVIIQGYQQVYLTAYSSCVPAYLRRKAVKQLLLLKIAVLLSRTQMKCRCDRSRYADIVQFKSVLHVFSLSSTFCPKYSTKCVVLSIIGSPEGSILRCAFFFIDLEQLIARKSC